MTRKKFSFYSFFSKYSFQKWDESRESISYRKIFRLGHGNKIFRYWLISVYRFKITAIYVFLYLNIYICIIYVSMNLIIFMFANKKFKIHIFYKPTYQLKYINQYIRLNKKNTELYDLYNLVFFRYILKEYWYRFNGWYGIFSQYDQYQYGIEFLGMNTHLKRNIDFIYILK